MHAVKQCLQNPEGTKNHLLKSGEQFCSQHENKSVYRGRTVRRQTVKYNEPIKGCGEFRQLGNLISLGDERDLKSICSSGIIHSGFRRIMSHTTYLKLQKTLSGGNIR